MQTTIKLDPESLAAATLRAIAAGWSFGGDHPGFWFHRPTWGSWKAAASWHGTDQEPSGADDRAAIYDSIAELVQAEGYIEGPAPRLFIGIFPGGVSYADRARERNGDYIRLGFLPYHSLQLEISRACPPDLRQEIEAHAATLRARRGEQFTISTCGQTVRLGEGC